VAGDPPADWLERRQGVKAAAARGDVPYLLAALTDPHHRPLAADALAELGETEAITAILRLLDASDPLTRIAALQALGKLQAKEAAPRIREIAKSDANPTARSWAAAVLAQMHDPDAFEVALPLLRDPTLTVRASAAHTLASIGDPRGLSALRAARPKPWQSPLDWWVNGETYRRAIAGLERRAAGKGPGFIESQWFRRLRRGISLLALVGACIVVGIYLGPWWAFLPLGLLVLSIILVAVLYFRVVPFD
jgi:HEAT repeat protein